jgi:hypothetical protein
MLLLASASIGLAGCGGSVITVADTRPATAPTPPTPTPAKHHRSQKAKPAPSKATHKRATPHSSGSRTGKTGPGTTTSQSTLPGGTNYASTYPPTFAGTFGQGCVGSGLSFTQCVCILRHIELAVPYAKAASKVGVLFAGARPSWYRTARTTCGVSS